MEVCMIRMKRKTVITIIFLLLSLALSACAPAAPDDQTAGDPSAAVNGAATEIPEYNTDTPEFWGDIGKTLFELKNEHPDGEFIVNLDGFPDSAAACFGEPGAEYVFLFFGGQSGDFEKAMRECADQIKCAGFITTADVLFPEMKEDMSFQDFFSLIGVSDYEYFGEDEDTITAEGWLKFRFRDMEVMVNTNEASAGGEWNFTSEKRVKSNAPVSIAAPEIFDANQDLADAVLFD